jgi:PAS domain S-box-containing protein
VIFRRTIEHTILRNWVVGAFAAMMLVGGAWLRSEHAHFRNDEARIRAAIVEQRKSELREQVERTIDLIAFMRDRTESRARDSARVTVQQAYATASFIRDKHRGKKSDAEIQGMILDAIRPIRFNRGRGYCFAFTEEGFQLLNADRPELEGTDRIAQQDARGAYLFRDMARIARTHGEGFYSYHWTKPNAKGRDFAKISFVKRFEPYGWVIGAGEYLDDADLEIREEVLARISASRFGTGGHLFAGTPQGVSLTEPVAAGVTRDSCDRLDGDAIRMLVAGGLEQGRFGTFGAADPGGASICYARAVPAWGWVVGGRSTLSDLDARVRQARAEVTGRYWRTMGKILALLALLFAGAVLVARLTAFRMRETFGRFSAFFRKGATETATIDPEGLIFAEFKELAAMANEMILARQRSEQRAARLASAVEQAAEDVVITDADGNIEYVNPSFERTTGYSASEALGRNCRILNGGAVEPAFYKELWETIRSGKSWNGRFRNRTKDGRLILQDANIAPIRDGAGGIAGYVSVRRDVTEHVEIEARLADSQRLEAIGVLAGGIAHDFNNILTAIVGYTEMALACTPQKSPLRDNLAQVLLGGKRATELVKQILAFSRHNRTEKRPVRFDEVIKETLKLIRAAVPSTVRIELSADCSAHVRANPTQLYQVVMNLCTNAAAAMAERGGTLGVRLAEVELDDRFASSHPGIEPGNYVRMTVSDTGCGIAPELIDHIFEPFFTTRSTSGGTGMGLAVVHGIVFSHGGTIDVSSVVGEGTAFEVYFPVSAGPEAETASSDVPPTGGTERILLVDDEGPIRRLVGSRLQSLGYEVVACRDGQAALERFNAEEGKFDLLISDVTMPGMTGDRLAVEIRKVRPDMPVILCSGYTERMTEEKARELGIQAFIAKPVSFQKLAVAIRAALETSPAPT